MSNPVCIICGSDESTVVERCEPPYTVVRCSRCGFVHVTPLPQALEDHYAEDYYKEWRDTQERPRLSMWKKRLKDLMRYKKQGRLLDVGCGLGTFLDLARSAGFDVHGTEVSEYICHFAKEKLSLNIFHGPLEDFPSGLDSFDVITLWHTLEHMPNPLACLEKARQLLRPDGLLVVGVPNVNNTIMRILYPLVRRRPYRLFSPTHKELHLSHFSQSTLSAILNKSGFEIVSIGPDIAQISIWKKLIDSATIIVYRLFNKNVGEGIRVYARKAR